MPKIKSNQSRVRKIRTPNNELMVKYEQIALLSAVYSQSKIVEKLHCSYGTIGSAMEFFKYTQLRESEFDWVLDVDKSFGIQIRMHNWTNRNTTYAIEVPTKFNQYLLDKIAENPNSTFDFRIQYQNHFFFDLGIIEPADMDLVFAALIGNEGLNPLLKTRYKKHLRLAEDRGSVILEPIEILPLEEVDSDEIDPNGQKKKAKKIGKTKLIATDKGVIML